MAIDFGKFSVSNSADSVLIPREIITALPSKAAKYQYPRDLQADARSQWFERRAEPELVIKMNTGGGKKVVGLEFLKSCLNEGIAPAVCMTPYPYLVGKVMEEARNLGIEATDDPTNFRFDRGRVILVTSNYNANQWQIRLSCWKGSQDQDGSLIDNGRTCLPCNNCEAIYHLS